MTSQGLFRKNVAALIRCESGFLACKRADVATWQCVQGGVEEGDAAPHASIIREIMEELGCLRHEFEVSAVSRWWRRYTFPEEFIRENDGKLKRFIGQEQLWFEVFLSKADSVCLSRSAGEFSAVQVVELERLISLYPAWKLSPFLDFCSERGISCCMQNKIFSQEVIDA